MLSKILLGLLIVALIVFFILVIPAVSGKSLLFLIGSIVLGVVACIGYDLFFGKK